MQIKIIETVTGDILTPADTKAMRLPFRFGWSSWGLFDDKGNCLDSYPHYSQAVTALHLTKSPNQLAA